MRALLLVLLCAAACDDNNPAASPDLSVVSDLSVVPDLTAKLTCAQTEDCITMCTSANLNTCVPACIGRIDPAAKSYFDALQACAGPNCTFIDGGFGPCADPGSGACQTCVVDNCGAEASACLSH